MSRVLAGIWGLRPPAFIAQVLESGVHVNAATSRIASGARGLEATVAEQVAATSHVVGRAREISETSDTLARTMGEVSAQSASAAAAASRCREDLEKMEAGMSEIEGASKLVGGRLAAINDKARRPRPSTSSARSTTCAPRWTAASRRSTCSPRGCGAPRTRCARCTAA